MNGKDDSPPYSNSSSSTMSMLKETSSNNYMPPEVKKKLIEHVHMRKKGVSEEKPHLGAKNIVTDKLMS